MKTIDIQSLIRPALRNLKPYSSARDEFDGTASIFLDANENPFAKGFNRYPDPHQRLLKQEISGIKNLKPDQIFVGNGSDECIDLLFRAFCTPERDNVIIPQPTYGMYSVSASINAVAVASPLLTKEFDVDSNTILHAVTGATKLIFLCSPNNPSGNLLSVREIEIILSSFNGLVVVDEAYIDFTTSPGWTRRLSKFQNLVVLQTLSKAWGLAGLRLGMCFADAEVIATLNKIKPPYNINAFTQTEALKVLRSGESRKNDWVEKIVKDRDEVGRALMSAKIVRRVFPSDANFLLVEVDHAKKVYQSLLEHGIVTRDRSNVVLCDHCLRITIGTHEENVQLIEVMKSL